MGCNSQTGKPSTSRLIANKGDQAERSQNAGQGLCKLFAMAVQARETLGRGNHKRISEERRSGDDLASRISSGYASIQDAQDFRTGEVSVSRLGSRLAGY